MTYQFDLGIQKGNFTVEVDPTAQYGFFEHDEYGDQCGGGLWFADNELIDYDGTYELPKPVIEGLRELGFKVGQDFE